jgi:hypothetical protein
MNGMLKEYFNLANQPPSAIQIPFAEENVVRFDFVWQKGTT